MEIISIITLVISVITPVIYGIKKGVKKFKKSSCHMNINEKNLTIDYSTEPKAVESNEFNKK